MNLKLSSLIILTVCTAPLWANQQPTGNFNPAYSASQVQAQLRLNIKENAETVHFIRDTNDPKIITKTYVLKYADPNSIRSYLREMVQCLRVDYNNAAGEANLAYYNVYSKDNADKSKKIFVPTGVECLQYTDGVGVLIVSAEAYRFEDSSIGMGIDSLVAALDQEGILNSSGQPKYIYFPGNRPASELQKMIKLVGANVSNDTVELIGGKDKIEVDEELNCLFLNTALYSRKNIEHMLRLYDVPHPEIRFSCTVYEVESENDGAIGFDFQAWKNNDGLKLFSAGNQYSHNRNLSDLSSPVKPNGTLNTHYFNFQPKWNSKFLDFLVSSGKAKVAYNGELTVKNNTTGILTRSGGIMYAAAVPIKDEKSGNIIDVKVGNDKFKFKMTLTPSITQKAAQINLAVSTSSILGYNSDGTLRTSNYDSAQKIMLGTGRNQIYLGGIEKAQTVTGQGGIPLLKDIPYLGWLFASERSSVKQTTLIMVAECEVIEHNTIIDQSDLERFSEIDGSYEKISL